MATSSRQEAKILDRIKSSLAQGDFYEAHQRYRALYFRLVSQNRAHDALSLLYSGAIELFNKEQVDSGTDLSLLFLTVLKDNKVDISREIIDRICVLHGRIRYDHPDRINFVNGALKWTIDVCRRQRAQARQQSRSTINSDGLENVDIRFVAKYGHPDIHSGFAMTFWRERNFPESRQHFLLSNDGASCGKMLMEFQQAVGYSTEIDLFIAQAVFHYLCHKRVSVAKAALQSYASQHPEISLSKPPFRLPLLNFLYFLLIALEQAKLAVFTVLCEQYATVLRRDPVFFKHLDRIGQLFFGLPPTEAATPSTPGGLLGGFINSIFSSMAEDSANEDMDDDEFDEDGEFYEVASEVPLPQVQRQPQQQPNNTFDPRSDLD